MIDWTMIDGKGMITQITITDRARAGIDPADLVISGYVGAVLGNDRAYIDTYQRGRHEAIIPVNIAGMDCNIRVTMLGYGGVLAGVYSTRISRVQIDVSGVGESLTPFQMSRGG